MTTNESVQQSDLSAHYHAPKQAHTFSRPLPSLAADFSTMEKTQYLSTLRLAVVELQKEVNVFLTAKMEEDTAQMATKGTKVDDVKEEANYGEEVVEED